MNKVTICLALVLSLMSCSSDDDGNTPAFFSGTVAASVDFNNTTASNIVTITDPNNNEDVFLSQTDTETTYGSFSITASGNWSYELDVSNTAVTTLATDSTLSEEIFVSSFDGTTTPITITINGVYIESAAVFGGDLEVSIENDTSAATTGTVTVTDANEGEDTIDVEVDLVTTYGTFSITDDGQWSYLLDTTNQTITGLVDGSDFVEDEIEIISTDGTTADIIITITGLGSTNKTKVASISDTMNDDAGELRYQLASGILTGKLSFSYYREDGIVTSEGASKDGFVTLYGDSTSGANALIDLRITQSAYSLRNESDVTISTAVTVEQWTDIEITWDASGASDTVAPLITIMIDGVDVTGGAFSSGSASLDLVKEGVKYFAFKLGDTTAVIPVGSFLFDDVKLYSDIAGTNIQFEDDFESYSVSDSLGTDNPASPYNGSTADTVVAEVDARDDVVELPTEPEVNQVVSITDTQDDETGELRYELSSEIAAGKMTVSYLREDGIETADGTSKDGFITLYGNSTAGANAIVDLRIKQDSYSLRNESDVDITAAVTENQWTEVEITWDATGASDTVAPTLTIFIDGIDVAGGTFSSGAGSLDQVKDGVKFVAFKLGDNSAVIPTGALLFDDLMIYSDLLGTTVQFEDDFESYSVGESLASENDSSPYHSATAEAVVTLE